MDSGETYGLADIFVSLQGEGRNTGRPAVFLRFAGCNLACPWCDTDCSEKMRMPLSEVVASVESSGMKSVIMTGGEPTLQPGLFKLAKELRARGCWIAIETNGVKALAEPGVFDYIAVSPKAEYSERYKSEDFQRSADEVRIVASDVNAMPFFERARRDFKANDYYVSPLDRFGRPGIPLALDMLSALNSRLQPGEKPWALSVQMHKFIGIK